MVNAISVSAAFLEGVSSLPDCGRALPLGDMRSRNDELGVEQVLHAGRTVPALVRGLLPALILLVLSPFEFANLALESLNRRLMCAHTRLCRGALVRTQGSFASGLGFVATGHFPGARSLQDEQAIGHRLLQLVHGRIK